MSSISSVATRLAVSSSTRHPRWNIASLAPVSACGARAQDCVCVCACVCACKGRGQPCQPCECDKDTETPACQPACGIDVGRRGADGAKQSEGQNLRQPQPQLAGFEVRNNGPFVTTSAGSSQCESSAGGGAETATVTASGDGQAGEGHPSREASNSSRPARQLAARQRRLTRY